MLTTCTTCGKSLRRSPAAIGRRNYCDLACLRADPAVHHRAQRRDAGIRKSEWTELECTQCGKHFSRRSKLVQTSRSFCSMDCKAESQRAPYGKRHPHYVRVKGIFAQYRTEIVPEWVGNFAAFLAYIDSLGPRPGSAVLDRIDRARPWGPGNIRWRRSIASTGHLQRISNAIERCHNPGNPGYAGYGGRGITVCQQWRDDQLLFADYLDSLGPCPPGHSLDRIDNDRGYEPGNLRWASPAQQRANQRRE